MLSAPIYAKGSLPLSPKEKSDEQILIDAHQFSSIHNARKANDCLHDESLKLRVESGNLCPDSGSCLKLLAFEDRSIDKKQTTPYLTEISTSRDDSSYQDDSRYCSSASQRVSDFQNVQMISTELNCDSQECISKTD